MEITSQIASLEDEVKLLKGEIKSVLKEIRAAVLNQDNPFGGANLTLGAGGTPPATASPEAAQPAPPPIPFPTPEAPPNPGFLDTRPEAVHTAPEPPRPASQVPAPIEAARQSAAAVEPEREQEGAGQAPSLHTIASLLAWMEDSAAALGPRRLRLTLELAYFAELLSPEVRDVLRDLAGLWTEPEEPEHSMSVNDCLLVLRQLEAIVHGEPVARLPRRHKRRYTQSTAQAL